jgi:Domain of unknown function (DUF5134)
MADEGVSAAAVARPSGAPRRGVTSITQLALAGLAGALISAVVVIAVTASGPATMMNQRNTWLPVGVRGAAVIAYAAIVVVHAWHMRNPALRVKVWHATHVLMAVGMIYMFAPTGRFMVAAHIGQAVFAAAVLGTFAYVAVGVVRGERLGWLWPATATDLAAMVYMFAAPIPEFRWLTGIFVGWSTLQAVGWLTGVLPRWADLGSPAGCSVPSGSSSQDVSVRVSLAAMNLGMAYMFLAMALGMASMSAPAPMPGMSGM